MVYRCSPRHPPHSEPVLPTSSTTYCTGYDLGDAVANYVMDAMANTGTLRTFTVPRLDCPRGDQVRHLAAAHLEPRASGQINSARHVRGCFITRIRQPPHVKLLLIELNEIL